LCWARSARTGLPPSDFPGRSDGLSAFGQLIAKKTGVEIGILRVELVLGIWIGAVTFTGSVIAYGKLAGKVAFAVSGRHSGPETARRASAERGGGGAVAGPADRLSGVGRFLGAGSADAAGLFIGYHLIMGIGGADMPVVVSMLNSYSGWAAAAIGFSLGNDLLIVVGALVGSSGAILSYIMCKAMNRSFVSVILGGFGGARGRQMAIEGERSPSTPMAWPRRWNDADSVIIVPGYGMAVAQAQQAVSELTQAARRARRCASPSTRSPAVCRGT
jgi:NAD(P) transhydrogenase subunit beta